MAAVVGMLFERPKSHLAESRSSEKPRCQTRTQRAEYDPRQGFPQIIRAGNELEPCTSGNATSARVPWTQVSKNYMRSEIQHLEGLHIHTYECLD